MNRIKECFLCKMEYDEPICEDCWKEEWVEEDIPQIIKEKTGRILCSSCIYRELTENDKWFNSKGETVCVECCEEEIHDECDTFDSDWENYTIEKSYKKFLDTHVLKDCPKCKAANFVLIGEQLESCFNCSWEVEDQ